MNELYIVAIGFVGCGLAFVGWVIGVVAQEVGGDIEPERWSGQ